ncbi:DUF4892 domain-containing protein [Simiduia curdlanivorans]|uniref:DUF4892 domain-containing protein n=1 Tax=Simiduia curdlanivorans TaxID=1492769 RepID=A0ABV8V2X3_9GAMM|nr:DUF4892 domain-containing protein [Simiduia curdlanivorans]MDN3640036.1 DUF4892 domain-containing protein [Simiduia curdlanivorans]
MPHDSRVVFQEESNVDDYLLLLGIYKRINNEWRTQGAEIISGRLQRKTIELPKGMSEAAAYQAFKEQLSVDQRRELFSCVDLLCGSSNAWANTHFGKAMLYGLDNNQRYGVFETQGADGAVAYTVIYAVKRGNGSVYVQLERIKVAASELGRLVTSTHSIATSIDERGYFSIPLSYGERQGLQVSAAQLQAIVDYIQSQRGAAFVLVGHDYSSGKDVMNLAEQHAQLVLALLKAKNIKAQLDVFSVGNLAPAGRGRQSVRVDLVRR